MFVHHQQGVCYLCMLKLQIRKMETFMQLGCYKIIYKLEPLKCGEIYDNQLAWLLPFLGSSAKLREATVSFLMSVRPRGTTRLPNGRIFVKFDIFNIFRKNLPRNFEFHSNLTTVTCTLHSTHRPIYISAHISLSTSYSKKKFQTKFLEKFETHFLFRKFFVSKIVPFMR